MRHYVLFALALPFLAAADDCEKGETAADRKARCDSQGLSAEMGCKAAGETDCAKVRKRAYNGCIKFP